MSDERVAAIRAFAEGPIWPEGEGVEVRAGKMGGAPCFAGTRIPVEMLLDGGGHGYTTAQLRVWYPDLTPEAVACGRAYVERHRALFVGARYRELVQDSDLTGWIRPGEEVIAGVAHLLAERDAALARVERLEAALRRLVTATGELSYNHVGDALWTGFIEAHTEAVAALRAELAVMREDGPCQCEDCVAERNRVIERPISGMTPTGALELPAGAGTKGGEAMSDGLPPAPGTEDEQRVARLRAAWTPIKPRGPVKYQTGWQIAKPDVMYLLDLAEEALLRRRGIERQEPTVNVALRGEEGGR